MSRHFVFSRDDFRKSISLLQEQYRERQLIEDIFQSCVQLVSEAGLAPFLRVECATVTLGAGVTGRAVSDS